MADYVALRPQFDRDSELWTYQDVVEFLLDAFGYTRTNSMAVRLCQRSIVQAMRDLPSRSRWSIYEGRVQLLTEAPYSTGTISYTNSNRQVTLVGGTWPTTATYYRLRIGTIDYEIQERISGTVVTLAYDSNPGADVVAGTAYSAYRSVYNLPPDWRRMVCLTDQSSKTELGFVESLSVSRQQVFQGSTGLPVSYTIRNSKDTYGSLAIEFGPAPSAARTYLMLYERGPRLLLTEKYSKGTVSTVGTALTGVNTAFANAHVGAIIRFSGDVTVEPTGIFGNSDDTSNPFTEQRVIMARGSSTTLTLDAALSADVTGMKYTISDPIDCWGQAMMTYVLRAAEVEAARLSAKKDIQTYIMFERQALMEAQAADSGARDSGFPGRSYPFHLMPWTTIPAEVVGGQA